ncbi:hypothetical protein INT43_006369 [Umbelopsis isabellina]|uniref:Cytochrome P450 n=1 Tax=Mortierella isabellina TaxID=91625 RepID=A0A8H7PZY9_MORIS|nr:hypothetical protein INT43_006369 [Umbelopsis isabellina]
MQSLLAAVSKDVDRLSAFYSEHILPYLARKSKATYIAAAIASFVTYQVYKMSHIPRNLRHIPAVPYWSYMRSVFSGTTQDARRDMIYSVLSKSPNGLYLKPSRGGWSVGVVGPQALRTVFLRKGIYTPINCIALSLHSNPNLIPQDDYPKSRALVTDKTFLVAKLIGGQNIISLNGSPWKKHRMIANPAFHRHMPVKLFGNLCEMMMDKFESESDGLSHVNVPALMQSNVGSRFTLDVIGQAGFGYDFESLENPDNEKVHIYNSIMEGLKNPLFFFFPFLERHFLWAFPNRRQQHENCDTLHQLFKSVIDNKRRVLVEQKEHNEDPEKDLLTLMLEAGEDDPSQALSVEELQENLTIFFIAGHDTTSNALSFALYLLAMNPDIQEKARREVLEVIGDGADMVHPTETQISQLKYIYMIMKETLRIHPPLQSSQLRVTEEDTELAGTVIPKGARLQADIFLAQHNPAVWKNPEEFRPERFAPGGENEENAKKGLAWAPFGNGARQCIGMNFSLAEQRVVLAMLLRKFTWSLPENSIHKDHLIFAPGMGLVNAKDLYLSFEKRF